MSTTATTVSSSRNQQMPEIPNIASSFMKKPGSRNGSITLQSNNVSKSTVVVGTRYSDACISDPYKNKSKKSLCFTTSRLDLNTDNIVKSDSLLGVSGSGADDFDEDSFLEAANNEQFDEELEEDPREYHFGGYHPVNISDIYNNKYKVIRKLGWGHFATVWLVAIIDPVTKNLDPKSEYSYAALKIIKSESRYAEAALDEIKILQHVNKGSDKHPGKKHVVKLLDHFILRGPNGHHVCMVLELLGENILCLTQKFRNLFDAYKNMCEDESKQKEFDKDQNKNIGHENQSDQQISSSSVNETIRFHQNPDPNNTLRLKLSDSMSFGDALDNLFTLDKVFKDYHGGLPMPLVKRITKQILFAVDYLHRDRGLIHTDFKPENILIEIKNVDKVVDFVHQEEKKRNSFLRTATFNSMTSVESSIVTPVTSNNISNEDVGPLERSQTFNSFKPSSTPPPPTPARLNTRLSINIPTTPVRGSKPLPSPIVRKSSIWSCCYGDSSNDSTSINNNKNVSNSSNNSTRKLSNSSSEQYNIFDNGYQKSKYFISTTSNLINNSGLENFGDSNNNNKMNSTINNPDFISNDDDYFIEKKSRLSEQLNFLKLKDVNFDKPANDKEQYEEITNNFDEEDENQENQALNEDDLEELDQFISVKVADLGNACYYDKHFSDFIQTREYRSPEVILKTEWGCSADMWSIGCIVFELITGDYLFKPRVKNLPKRCKFDTQKLKDIDHLSKIIGSLLDYKYLKNKIDCYDYYDKYFFDDNEQELFEVDIKKLPESPPENFDIVKMQNVDENTYNYTKGNKFGPFLIPINMYSKSRYAKKLFDDSLRNLVFSYQQYRDKEKFNDSEQKNTHNSKEKVNVVAPYKIHFVPLYDVFLDEYHLGTQEASEICDFLLRMLEINPRYREDAGSLSNHEWLDLDDDSATTETIEDCKIDRKKGMNGQDILGWFYEYEHGTSSKFGI